MEPGAAISCCFDEESQHMLDDYRKKGLGHTSAAIMEALAEKGLAGSSVLEVGCGIGGLTIELLRRGASNAVGVDISPRMVELARSLAAESGLSKSASFEQGDGAVARLKGSDFVILDTVLCCYPNVVSLVGNSSSAAQRYYVISVPDDTRIATRILSVFLPLQRVAFRRGGFRFYIHPLSLIKLMLGDRGFKLVSKAKAGWIWSVLLFAAPASAR